MEQKLPRKLSRTWKAFIGITSHKTSSWYLPMDKEMVVSFVNNKLPMI